jgi:maltooligosyltrehalose trehalohydrolase
MPAGGIGPILAKLGRGAAPHPCSHLPIVRISDVIDDPLVPPTALIPIDATSARWRVWAPKARGVELVLGLGDSARRVAMEPDERGYHTVTTDRPEPGRRYAYALDGGPPLPDPCSRWQPDGTGAPSAVWFPEPFTWDEGGWAGIERADLVFYELHVGTFTPEGTFDAIHDRLDALRELGITAIELMPVGQFPGTQSWGYDGVHPFAPQQSYGGPEGLKRLVEACHRKGLAIFLDVVYNHFGPEGNVFPIFGDYLTEKYKTGWGPAINYDDRHCDPVRGMILENVRHWIRDYRFDGLRLDASDQIFDRGPRHILAEAAEVAHVEAEGLGRKAHLFAETDQNDAPRYLRPVDRGGYGLDGHWNDDFHHAAHVVLTGETSGYYTDFTPGPEALAKALERVFVNDGNFSPFRGRRHGTPATEFAGDRFVAFTQNHDQVGNRAKSDRHAASLPPSAVRLAAGILLLAPRLPLLFMGQEYGETNPFPFFCGFAEPELIEAVRKGRKEEFAYFGWEGEVLDPLAPTTRDRAVLSWSWDDPVRSGLRRLHRDLIRLRRESRPLRDTHHARTRLHGPDVLEVVRGDPSTGPEATIVFNLSDQDRHVPPALSGRAPTFRSEGSAYNPSATGRSETDRLAPHEFIFVS